MKPIDSTFLPQTLAEMFERTVAGYGGRKAYSEWDAEKKDWKSLTWSEFGADVARWKRALAAENLPRGARVSILIPNSIDAARCDMAVLGRDLTPVPLHAVDTPKSSAFIMNDSESSLLFINKALRWNAITSAESSFPSLKKVVILDDDLTNTEHSPVPVVGLTEWLKGGDALVSCEEQVPTPESLAAIVYTSGTTGKSKGVMLSHRAIVTNVLDCHKTLNIRTEDEFLSILPFSHTFERTFGYYLPMLRGAHVAFSRSVMHIAEELKSIRPTVFISVPRIYERFQTRVEEQFHKKGDFSQIMLNTAVNFGWRRFCRENKLPVENIPNSWLEPFIGPYLDAKIAQPVRDIFGGRLRIGVVGGAALSKKMGRFFCGLGLPLFQGYGLTETSPVICVNVPGFNNPETCGQTLPSVEVRLGDHEELQVKAPSVMLGYWKRPDATAEAFTSDGWFRTGDQADLSDPHGIRICGRIKEIIVTSTGEKMAPGDLQLAIQHDPLFEQAMVVGEARPFVTCLVVLNKELWAQFAAEHKFDPEDLRNLERRDIRLAVLKRIKKTCAGFPQYAVPRNVGLLLEPWTVENGCLTVTMKLKRKVVAERYPELIESLYVTPQNH